MPSRPCRPREIRCIAWVNLRRRWSMRASFSMMPASRTASPRRLTTRQRVGLPASWDRPTRKRESASCSSTRATSTGSSATRVGRPGGPLEEVDGLAVGELRQRAFPGQDGVAPGLLVTGRVEEVQRQQLALRLSGSVDASLDGWPDLVVQDLAPPNGSPS